MDRREYIATFGAIGLGSIAGCTGGSGDGESETTDAPSTTEQPTSEVITQEPTTEETTEVQEAVFEFIEVSPKNTEIPADQEITFEANFENTGNAAGTKTIELEIEGEHMADGEFELAPGESTSATVVYNPDAFSAGTWRYSFRSEDDSISAEFTVTEPEIEQPEAQNFSGSGETVEEGVEIEGGLTVIEASHSGDSNFQVTLLGDSEYGTNFVNAIGSYSGAQAELVESGTYILEVNADSNWDITLKQPRATSGESLPISLSGQGPNVMGPYDFTGRHIATGSHSGSSNFQVQVYPMEGMFGESVFNEIGEFSGETTFSHDGVGWIEVFADGEWSLEIE